MVAQHSTRFEPAVVSQVAGGALALMEDAPVTASGEFIYGMNCASEKEHIFPRLEALLLRISRLLPIVFLDLDLPVGDRFVIALVHSRRGNCSSRVKMCINGNRSFLLHSSFYLSPSVRPSSSSLWWLVSFGNLVGIIFGSS